MSGIKSLVKDTAIYGVSSIVGRMLNYLLVPFYTRILLPEEYGVVGILYGYVGVLLVLLNYGMETGFFRFANKRQNPMTVYSTSLISVGTTSLLFIALLTAFISPVSSAINMGDKKLFVWLLGVTVAIDAFTNIPFAYLRFSKQAKRFAAIKMTNILVNIGLNIFFLKVCRDIYASHPSLIRWFYGLMGGDAFGVGWIFVANLLSSLLMLIMLVPNIWGIKWKFDGLLLKKMLNFSFPILITGVAGTFAHNMGQIFIPYIFSSVPAKAEMMVGIYSANIKIAVILTMFTQAFRFAYEPFIFSNSGSGIKEKNKAYCDAMKYFVIFSMLIFMGVMFFLPIIRQLIGPKYQSGLDIVPIVMGAEICFGIYFNLSIWYKLTDKTSWGSWFSVLTFVLMAGLNVVLVRYFGDVRGYVGSALASLIAYGVVMILCWMVGRFYYPLNYQIGRISVYVILALGLTYVGLFMADKFHLVIGWAAKIFFLITYIIIVLRTEKFPIPSTLKR
ncbi:MAG: oligosaccharide flippase family protein [Muribaculaceae bacterium]|nr:oligosaccharide flippase family protein [Muribaculaceae bacterium]